MLAEHLEFASAVKKPRLVRGWSGFTAHSLKQTALFAGMSVIAANLWNVFTRLGDDGTPREAATSRPLLQSCVARLSRHARQGVVTIYTATSERARGIYRAISTFLSKVSSAPQLSLEERRQLIIAHAFREYGTIRRMFSPDIGVQMTMPPPDAAICDSHERLSQPASADRQRRHCLNCDF